MKRVIRGRTRHDISPGATDIAYSADPDFFVGDGRRQFHKGLIRRAVHRNSPQISCGVDCYPRPLSKPFRSTGSSPAHKGVVGESFRAHEGSGKATVLVRIPGKGRGRNTFSYAQHMSPADYVDQSEPRALASGASTVVRSIIVAARIEDAGFRSAQPSLRHWAGRTQARSHRRDILHVQRRPGRPGLAQGLATVAR